MKVINIDVTYNYDGLFFKVEYKKTIFSKAITEVYAELDGFKYSFFPNLHVFITVPHQKVIKAHSKMSKILNTYRKNNVYPLFTPNKSIWTEKCLFI